MSQKLALIKLGGSLITDKSKPYTTRPKVITRLVKEIKDVLKLRPDLRLVIGNGAGSFAHQSAKQYGTVNGFSDDQGKYGYCVVQNDAARLNRIIVAEFLKQGVAAIGFQPSTVMLSRNKQKNYENFYVLKEYVDKGIIPIVYGDAILDTVLGSTIYSTDKIIDIIATQFKKSYKYEVESIISLGNYDGVIDNANKVIPLITAQNFQKMKNVFYKSNTVDVTGGMESKVKELLEIAQMGLKSVITNGGVENNLQKALLGEKINGTVIA